MKVLYILAHSSTNESSVKKKVMKQIQYLNSSDFICKGAFFTTDVLIETPLNENINYMPVKKTNSKYFNPIKSKIETNKAITKYINNVSKEFDAIYYRYSGASYSLYKLVNKHSNILFEMNDSTIMTVKRGKINFSIRRSLIVQLINDYYWPYYSEVLFGHKTFEKCKAISSVSGELFENIKKEYNLNNPVPIVIGNGIDVEAIKLRSYHFEDINISKKITLLMLKGASTDAVYLGNDRIIKALANYKGEWKVKLIFAGKYFEDEKKLVKSLGLIENCEFVGYLSEEQIDNYVNKCDLAIGTLAAYRSKIDEISSLKAREYFSRGIPFIYAYTDTDIDKNQEAKKYCLKLKNDDSLIDLQQIIKFALEVLSKKNHHIEMRSIALDILDFRKKMRLMADKIKKVYA